MKIYADVYLVQNFIVNMVTLYLMNSLLGLKKNYKRFGIASVMGAGYALYVLLASRSILTHIVSKILVLIGMLIIANRFSSVKSLLKQVVCYLTLTLLFGGCVLVLRDQFFSGQTLTYRSLTLNNLSFSLYLLVLAVLIAYKYLIVKYIYGYRLAQYTTVLVKAVLGKRQIEVATILDTGNRLVDPLTQRPIIIVSLAALKQQLPAEIYNALITYAETLEINKQMATEEQSILYKCKFIPYKSLGSPHKMLLTIKPDDITYVFQNREHYGIEALLGLAPKGYFSNRSFQGLMHPTIFQHLTET